MLRMYADALSDVNMIRVPVISLKTNAPTMMDIIVVVA